MNNLQNKLLNFIIYVLPIFIILGNLYVNLFYFFLIIFFILNFKMFKYYDFLNNFILFFFIYILIVNVINLNFVYWENAFLYVLYVILTLIFIYGIKSKIIKLEKILFFYLIIFTIVLFDTYFQYFTSKNILGYEIEPNNKIRLTSFFKDKYVVGSFLAKLSIPLITFVYLKSKQYKILLSLTFSFLTFIAIFLSGERAAFIIFFVGIMLTFIFISKLRNLIYIYLLIASILVPVLLIYNQNIHKRFIDETIKDTFSISSSKRILDNHYGAIFLASLELIKEKPFFGHGTKGYRRNVCDPDKFLIIQNKIKNNTNHHKFICSTHPHNNILEYLIDYGVMGLIFYLIYLCYFLIRVIEIRKLDPICTAFGVQFLANSFFFITQGSHFASWNFIFLLLNFSFFNALYVLKKNQYI